MSRSIHDLTPLRTRRSMLDNSDGGPRTPDLSSSASTAPSSAFSRSSRQASWNFGTDDSMEAPPSVRVLKSSHASLDLNSVLEQLQIAESPSGKSSQKPNKLLELIGRGTHADVHRATLSGFEVAAKVPNCKGSVPFIEREREVLDFICRSTEDLENIIEHYHGKELDNKSMLFMELGDCDMLGYLRSEINSQRSTAEPIVGIHRWHDIATSITSGVASLHQIGLVHSDIKPQNVLWTDDGIPKLIDFEGAFTPEGDLPRMKQRGYDVVGTTIYNAPELLRSAFAAPTFATDIYALGVTLLVLATGEEPYAHARNGLEQIIQCQTGDPIRYAGSRSRITPAIEKIVRGCCAKNASDRWVVDQVLANLADLKQDLVDQ